MNWIFSHGTQDELISMLTSPLDNLFMSAEVIDHTLEGTTLLWTLVRVTAKQPNSNGLAVGASGTYIRCYLLQSANDGWGYIPMNESDGLPYYSCPMHYLEAAPTLSEAWRSGVHVYHHQAQVEEPPPSA